MKYFKLIFLFCILEFSTVQGQVAIGSWMDHFSMKDVTKIVSYKSRVYGATSNGIIIYDVDDNSIQKLTKANGLSDVGISSIGIDKQGTLIIGYDNGNIDIVFENEIFNMRDLLRKNMQSSKNINEISTYEGKAYLSCDFGIVVLNINKKEISDTYILSNDASTNLVNNTIINDSIIYSATSKGVFTSSLNNPRIQIFSSWSQISEDTQNYCDLAIFNNDLFFVKGKKDASSTLKLFKDGLLSDLFTIPSFRQLSTSEHLLITDRSQLIVLDNSYISIKTVNAGNESFLSANEINKIFFSGKVGKGIVKYSDLLIEDQVFQDILPNGPYSNNSFEIKSSSFGVWVLPGGVTTIWNNLGIEPYFSFYNGNSWENFSKIDFPEFSGECDLLRVAINPNTPSSVSFCSWGSGIFELEKNQSILHYDQHNSLLKNIFPEDNNYVRVGGIAIDKNGATWMNNSRAELGGLVVKTLDNDWYVYDYEITSYQHSQGQICVTKNNFKWSFFPTANRGQSGIFVWDDNGTLSNSYDDRYRGPIKVSNDYRNKGELRLWNSDKVEITNAVNCLAEDKSGALWIGTDKGPLVYYRPASIFDEEYPVATQINLPRNDGSGLGDYLLGQEVITCIAIDDANRKWFGTSTSGVYLISADGTLQIDHFTVDNSALPSNSIVAINYKKETGEIFIGTSQGLVSYKGTSVESSKDIGSPYVYPNPVNPGYSGLITIKGIMTDSNIKVTDASGNLINELKSLGGQAVWDGNNFNGQRVSSGIYYFLIVNSDGTESGKTKVLIVN